jgi:hypothetical protein
VTVFRVLGRIAPKVEPKQFKPDLNVVDYLDLESMDFLNLVIGVHQEVHLENLEVGYSNFSIE